MVGGWQSINHPGTMSVVCELRHGQTNRHHPSCPINDRYPTDVDSPQTRHCPLILLNLLAMTTTDIRHPHSKNVWTERPKWLCTGDKNAVSDDPDPGHVSGVTAMRQVTPTPRLSSFLPPPSEEQTYFLCLRAGSYRILPCNKGDTMSALPTPATTRSPSRMDLRARCAELPDELWIEILSYLDSGDILALRPVSSRLARIALQPSLHRRWHVHLNESLELTLSRRQVMPYLRHLRISSTLPPYRTHGRLDTHPTARLLELLRALPPSTVRTLDVPNIRHHTRWGYYEHWAQWRLVGSELRRIGGKVEVLNLANAGIDGRDWVEGWGEAMGTEGRGLRDVDLSHNLIHGLPTSPSWTGIERLSLRYAYALPRDCTHYLERLERLKFVDLTGVHQLDVASLYRLPVVLDEDGGKEREEEEPSGGKGRRLAPLAEVRIVDIDNLAIADVQALQHHWGAQRASICQSPWAHNTTPSPSEDDEADDMSTNHPWLPTTPELDTHPNPHANAYACMFGKRAPPPRPPGALAIVHSAVLESDNEEGYRQYIADMVEGTLVGPRVREVWA